MCGKCLTYLCSFSLLIAVQFSDLKRSNLNLWREKTINIFCFLVLIKLQSAEFPQVDHLDVS